MTDARPCRYGTYSTAEALVNGMDLEMPGHTLFRGQALRRALIGGKVEESHIDAAVRRVHMARSDAFSAR